MIVGLLGCSSSHPSLPEASKIKTIKAVADYGKSTYLISSDRYPEILALFKIGTRDNNPAKWQVMGYDLEITTVDGEQINIWLFKTFKGRGAFAVGRLWTERHYYRGATDEQIDETIKKTNGTQQQKTD